jgi:hypothetical protein
MKQPPNQKDSSNSELYVIQLMRFYDIKHSHIATRIGSNGHTVKRALDQKGSLTTLHRNILLTRKMIEQILIEKGWRGDLKALWDEFDNI